MNFYLLLRPVLFRLDSERAHHLSLRALQIAGSNPITLRVLRGAFMMNEPCLHTRAFGLEFANPVGLAAGYDKNGVAVAGLAALGFGHVEIGTITRRPQPGNPKPRMHRVIESEGVINALGFPNEGVDALSTKGSVEISRSTLGINIGKGKDTPLENAAEDYVALLNALAPFASYVTVNISSPNTPELRKLQTRAFIAGLLMEVTQARDALTRRVPVLVKIAPDLSDAELDDILDAIQTTGIDGVIATNTTLSRAGIPAQYVELKGGLSGASLRSPSTQMIGKIYARTSGTLPIVGVGGINSAEAALEKIRAGAVLVQVYTGLVYKGPGLVKEINRGIVAECARTGVRSVGELVGQDKGL